MTFTIPSAVLPRLTPGKRNRGSLESFQSAYVLVKTCSVHITLCNKNSCADVQISITIHTQGLRDVFTEK